MYVLIDENLIDMVIMIEQFHIIQPFELCELYVNIH